MRLLSVTTALFVGVLCAGCAVGAWHRAEALRSEASWLMERSRAQATEYTQSFNDAVASQQLETFAKRRAVLEQAYLWQRVQTLGILFAAAAAACAWVLSLLRRINGALDEATEGLDDTSLRAEPIPVPVPVRAHLPRSRA
ncbi:hypothetical protein [Archangium primigenium]|uniref:hypothetical protein n=1 Tax=[Archangium] primigenium TaxID=2792470 RepID=UPI00195EB4C4|nr:hypothetical protein [Archangium primigenium]MBM7115305.1 hypothetical protein [Archangium primigenium]